MAWLSFAWRQRPKPHRVNQNYLEQLSLLEGTLTRFTHAYEGEFLIPLQGATLQLLLEDDLLFVFDRLPAWLACLAAGDGSADLLFGSQGTELVLIAARSGKTVTVSATSLDQTRPFVGGPLVVSLCIFFEDWTRFLLALLDALAEIEPKLNADEAWQRYRSEIAAVAAARAQHG